MEMDRRTLGWMWGQMGSTIGDGDGQTDTGVDGGVGGVNEGRWGRTDGRWGGQKDGREGWMG